RPRAARRLTHSLRPHFGLTPRRCRHGPACQASFRPHGLSEVGENGSPGKDEIRGPGQRSRARGALGGRHVWGLRMKRKLLVAVPLLCVVALLAWIFRPKHESLGEAYVSERSVTLWSSVAQVREQLGVLLYGDHVEVLSRRNENVKVRTAAGLV